MTIQFLALTRLGGMVSEKNILHAWLMNLMHIGAPFSFYKLLPCLSMSVAPPFTFYMTAVYPKLGPNNIYLYKYTCMLFNFLSCKNLRP